MVRTKRAISTLDAPVLYVLASLPFIKTLYQEAGEHYYIYSVVHAPQ